MRSLVQAYTAFVCQPARSVCMYVYALRACWRTHECSYSRVCASVALKHPGVRALVLGLPPNLAGERACSVTVREPQNVPRQRRAARLAPHAAGLQVPKQLLRRHLLLDNVAQRIIISSGSSVISSINIKKYQQVTQKEMDGRRTPRRSASISSKMATAARVAASSSSPQTSTRSSRTARSMLAGRIARAPRTNFIFFLLFWKIVLAPQAACGCLIALSAGARAGPRWSASRLRPRASRAARGTVMANVYS